MAGLALRPTMTFCFTSPDPNKNLICVKTCKMLSLLLNKYYISLGKTEIMNKAT